MAAISQEGDSDYMLAMKRAAALAAKNPNIAGTGIAPANSPGGEDPNHLSTATEPTSIGGLAAPTSDTAAQRALAGATAGGPPVPNFSGTFGGVQYSSGQPVSTSTTSTPTTTTPPGTGGSLATALQPPPTTRTTTQPTTVNQPTTPTQAGSTDTALSRAAAAPAVAPTTTPAAGPLQNQNLADRATVNGVEVWAGGPNSGQPTATTSGELVPGQGGQGQGSSDLAGLTNQITQTLQGFSQGLAQGSSPDVTGVFLQQSKSILAMLDDQEAQLRAENEKAGTTVDPATQFTIDKLRQTLEENLKTTREDLNRRGLNESGIELALEQKLRTGSASDQAGILAQRLSGLQAQLAAGLSNIRQNKYSTVSQFGQSAANAQFTAGENAKKDALQREQDAVSGMLNLRGQMSTAQNARNSEQGAMQRALLSEQGSNARTAATLAQNQNQFGNLSAYQSAQIDQSNQDRSAAMARAASSANTSRAANTYTNPTGSSYQSNPTQTQGALAALAGNYDLNDPAQNQAAQQSVIQNAQAIINKGVDPAALLDSIRARNVGPGSR